MEHVIAQMNAVGKRNITVLFPSGLTVLSLKYRVEYYFKTLILVR